MSGFGRQGANVVWFDLELHGGASLSCTCASGSYQEHLPIPRENGLRAARALRVCEVVWCFAIHMLLQQFSPFVTINISKDFNDSSHRMCYITSEKDRSTTQLRKLGKRHAILSPPVGIIRKDSNVKPSRRNLLIYKCSILLIFLFYLTFFFEITIISRLSPQKPCGDFFCPLFPGGSEIWYAPTPRYCCRRGITPTLGTTTTRHRRDLG
jgi:hypothetical protein